MRYLRLSAVAVAACAAFTTFTISAPDPAVAAKVCKPGKITATSRPFRTRITGAFPASLIAWGNKARRRHGNRFSFWNRAEQKRVTCSQTRTPQGRRWQCTRVARACAGFGKLQPLPRCAGRLAASGAARRSQAVARRSARNAWSGKARTRFGGQYRRWSRAKGKSVTCKRVKGRYTCRAAARACRA